MLCRVSGAVQWCTPSAIGSYGRQAGWLADEIQVNFKIRYRLKCRVFASFNVQQYYNIFQLKPVVRWFL